MLVSIVVPTKNEELNIKELIRGIWDSLVPYYNDIQYEIFVVDDGHDATANIARLNKARVIQGDHKGLGHAILQGVNHSNGEVVLVMDADLSHNPKYIPDLLKPIIYQGYDMTIGSRYCKGGQIQGWTKERAIVSKVASFMAYPLTWFKDNTSGFFAFRKSVIKDIKLKPDSWKIMLEILVRANPTAVMEVPITFCDRKNGQSKFSEKQISDYLIHVCKLGAYKYSSFLRFGFIGLMGAAIHFALLYTLTEYTGLWYILSAICSIVVASTFNYFMNHRYTFKDRFVSNHLLGWLKYQFLSGITDSIYLGLLALFTQVFGLWYMASALIGVMLVYPVKFVLASSLIWGKRMNVNDPDYEWNAYFKGSTIQKWWKRSIANTVWDWIPQSDSILDYGCGSSPIVTKYGSVAVGCDADLPKLKYMGNKCPLVNYVNGSLESLERKYDHALCIEVIEHIESPDYLMDYFNSVVKKDGLLVIATPDYGRWWWYVAELFTPYKDAHVKKYTRKSLENLCDKYGFSPVKYKYVAGCDLIEMFARR